jgi:uncharacterized protein with von Willebrand factor type A (vWA) domain
MDDKLKILYDAVSKDYDLGTFNEFATKIQDPTKRKAFYDGVGKEYDLGSYSDFEQKVGGKKKSRDFYARFCEWIRLIYQSIRSFPTA